MLDGFERRLAVRLPVLHRRLLAASNGLEGRDDFQRLYGVGPAAMCDMERWNSLEAWKFAWPDEVQECLFFGGDALGTQFGYRLADLAADPETAPVHAVSLDDPRVRVVAGSFAPYLERWVDDALASPGSPLEHQLRPDAVVVRSPALLLAGAVTGDDSLQLDASVALVLGGDAWTQVGQAEPGREMERFEAYVDQNGRARLRVIWA